MKQTVLREHGTHTEIEYIVSLEPGDPAAWPREKVWEIDDSGTMLHTRRYDKAERAAEQSFTLGRLRHVYADAIEYTAALKKRDGGSLLWALFGYFVLLLSIFGLAWFMDENPEGPRLSFTAFILFAFIVPWLVWAIFDGWKFPWENLFFTLEDAPIVFDRKHRKVYRLLPREGTGVWNAILRRPLVACEYDWDLIDVECETRKGYLYEPKRPSTLTFWVRYSRTYSTTFDWFEIKVRELEGENLDPMWEHIRRFMDEDGPALPDPAEGLAPRAPRESWWACLRMTGPQAPLFLGQWRAEPLGSLLSLLFSPVSLPIRLVWGTTNYLVRKTEFPVRWPTLIQERLGASLPAPPVPVPVEPEVPAQKAGKGGERRARPGRIPGNAYKPASRKHGNTETEFREHGWEVDLDYPGVWLPDPSSQPRESVDDDEGTIIHRRRYDKREQVTSTPRTMGRLRHVFADAIEYAGTRGPAEKGSLLGGAVVATPLLIASAWLGPWMGSLVAAFGIYMAGMFASGLLFRLKTLPVVFDRRHRKVYRMRPNEGTGVMGVLRRRPLVACEYDWDLIDVQSCKRRSRTRGKTSDCSLIFRVRRSREDSTMIDLFDIEVRELAHGSVDPMWEHIRRFMEEGGPHRPDPDEPLRHSTAPPGWRESLGMTGPWKPLFPELQGRSPLLGAPLFLICLSLFLLGLPFRLLACLETWLRGKTRIPVRWPAAVRERIGQPLPAEPPPPPHASAAP